MNGRRSQVRAGRFSSVVPPVVEEPCPELEIEKLVPGGAGLAHREGEVAFVSRVAPGDVVRGVVTGRRRGYLTVRPLEILRAGAERVDTGCPHDASCGGCGWRHLASALQERAKADFVREGLVRIGHFRDTGVVGSLLAADGRDGYRRRAGFKLVRAGESVGLGFFAEGSNRLVDLQVCPVLDPRLEGLMAPLRRLFAALPPRLGVAGVDAVAGDVGTGLVFYLKQPLSGADKEAVLRFATENGVSRIRLAGASGRTSRLLHGTGALHYAVDGFELGFDPEDFIQAHAGQNRRLVAETLALAGEGRRAWDLFCGVGNFSLPLTRRFPRVIGVEQRAGSVERATENARKNRVKGVEFRCGDLFDPAFLDQLTAAFQPEDVVVLDPPRSGAEALCRRLAERGPGRLVHVSCDPATFARDAARLVAGGYELKSARPVDLFPQTWHVEIVALFERR